MVQKNFADADFHIINGVLTGVSDKIKNQEKVVIPDGVITLSGTLFADYSTTTGRLEFNETVKEIVLPNSLTKMDSAFKGCVNLNNVRIPKSVQEMTAATFGDCKSITEIILPEGLTYVGNSLCKGCTNLERIVLPSTVTEIRGSAFNHCKNLKEINIPNGVTKIENFAFDSCKSLEKIILPDTLVSVGTMAFWCCEKLSEITIPPSLTDIDDNAFGLTPWFENSRDENGLVIVNHVLLDFGFVKNNILYIPNGVTAFVCDAPYMQMPVVIPPSVTDLSKFTYGDGRIHVVYGVPGSYAEQDAKKYNKTFHAIALNRSSLSLTKGKSYRLSFNCGSDAVWKSSNSKVVSVDQNGKITAKKNGTATITATLYGKKYTCKVTVSAKTYTVKRGDTLWGIAAKQLGSGYRYKEIMKLNGLKSTRIVSGQRLKLPER